MSQSRISIGGEAKHEARDDSTAATTMSAAMLKQMMEEAGAFLKEEKYAQALESARRVSQFDANNFQALMCVGLASFHLKQWEDSEAALRRAADLKPDLPAPWKNLVDLFDASGDVKKKIEALEKLIGVFRKGNKVKPSQKWIAELAAAATSVKLYGKAFDAWYTLVDETQDLSVDATPNEELPSSLVIWLSLLDLLQLPNFSLSDAKGSEVTMSTLLDQFAAVASRWQWTDATAETEALQTKTDVALAMFLRFQLNQVKNAKAGKAKQSELQKLDAFTASLIQWFPSSKLPVEYLLLRSEDQDSPIDDDASANIAAELAKSFAKSPISLMFQGFAAFKSDGVKARDLVIEGLASCSASSFHESSLCVRAQMLLASIALDARDVEGCLSRLQKAQEVVQEKAAAFGCAPPKATVFSEVKVQLLQARAHDLVGSLDEALDAYKIVIAMATSEGEFDAVSEACSGAAELLCSKNKATEAVELIDSVISSGRLADAVRSSLLCSKAWAKYILGDAEAAKTLFEENFAKLSSIPARARALKRLAIVFWHLGGEYRSDKAMCFGSLLQAAKLAPNDGEVFAWLGKWYKEVGGDVVRAEKCFLKALALTPLNELAGLALSQVYEEQGKTDLNVKLWEDLTLAPESAPTWALLRLAQHLVDQDDETAVSKMHLVLRNEPLNTIYWVAMGHVYRHFGKLVAAQRSYLRAIELGETGWCVLTELARIEGSLHLFDDALLRIERALEDNNDAPKDVISTVYAELLFEQAKFLNGEGLYGRAAANITKASTLLQPVVQAGSNVPTLKLLGDIRSFAFYLSPMQFGDNGWIKFLSRGREAYEKIVELLPKGANDALAQAHYDLGVSCWYVARATYSSHGKRFNAFGSNAENLDIASAHLQDARKHLRAALEYDPSHGLAWNALGVVLEHPLMKQFAWIRAIQVTNNDVAWANLGMLYVHNRGQDESRSAELARNAFLHLQATNPNNPAMWIGYGMIYLGQHNAKERRKAREAFQCALEMGNHLDALQGFVLSSILSQYEKISSVDNEADEPSHEQLLFAIKKYLERESFDASAWSVLSLVQFRLGLVSEAVKASTKSLELLRGEKNEAIERNGAILAAIHRITTKPESGADFKSVLANLITPSTSRSIVEAQQRFHAADNLGALKTAHSLLHETPSTDEYQLGLVAGFALALSSLIMEAHPAQAKDLGNSALATLFDRVASGNTTSDELEAIDAFHRAAESLDSFTSALDNTTQASSGNLVTKWSLALVDLLDPKAFSAKPTCGEDVLQLSALKSLLTSDQAHGAGEASSPMKLVRAEPWNPAAYALAALRAYKTVMFGDENSLQHDSALASALRLLDTGLLVAEAEMTSSQSKLLLHWAYALIQRQVGGEATTVKVHVDKALAILNDASALSMSRVNRLLWEARVHSLSEQSTAITKYTEALRQAKLTARYDTILPLLYELGGVCESFGFLDAAHHVWKTVMTWKSTSSASETENVLNVTAFVGNLHLAIVHASKNNAKSAKKFAKNAVGLASGETSESTDAVTSSNATTARFVDSVVAKM